MNEFRKLVATLERELKSQEHLLKVLAHERAAIVEMNQEKIEEITCHKESAFSDAIDLQCERERLITQILGDEVETVKFTDLLENCPSADVKKDLVNVRDLLKEAASSVEAMNVHNAILIKQAIGLVSSTIAIFRSAPGTDLPTYTQRGKLSSDSPDPAFSGRSRTLIREA